MTHTTPPEFWRVHDQNLIDLAEWAKDPHWGPYTRRVFDIKALLDKWREERRPKICDDIAGANSLPTGTIVVDAIGRAVQKMLGGTWLMVGVHDELTAGQLEYPIVVAALSPMSDEDES